MCCSLSFYNGIIDDSPAEFDATLVAIMNTYILVLTASLDLKLKGPNHRLLAFTDLPRNNFIPIGPDYCKNEESSL